MEPSVPRRRTGGRSARVRESVLTATLDLLSQDAAAFSVAAVAARAGVHETSIYRRWGTRERLALDALLDFSAEHIPIPDTGAVHGDLVAFGRALGHYLSLPLGAALTRIMATLDTETAAAFSASREDFWTRRFDAASAMITRAVARGELPPETNTLLLLETFIAPFHFRALHGPTPLSPAEINNLATLVLNGARSR